MIPQFGAGALLFAASVLLHALVIAGVVRFEVFLLRRGYGGSAYWKNTATVVASSFIVSGSHLVHIWLWAFAYLAIGEFGNLPTALYYSAVTYTTLGYGDVVMSERWRLLGPMESLTGFILIGISTATMLAVMGRLIDIRMHFLARHWDAPADQASPRSETADPAR